MLLLVSCFDIAYRLKPRLTDNSVAEGFSHRLRPMKNVEHSFGRSCLRRFPDYSGQQLADYNL